MTQDEIREVHAELVKMRSAVGRWIADLHVRCTHPEVKKEYKANTGNYDPSADSYWIHFECPDCGKVWNVHNVDREAYRMGMK